MDNIKKQFTGSVRVAFADIKLYHVGWFMGREIYLKGSISNDTRADEEAVLYFVKIVTDCLDLVKDNNDKGG